MRRMFRSTMGLAGLAALALLASPSPAAAHCDTMDGPVVKAALRALETGDLNPVLPWIRDQDERGIRNAFDHTLRVRSLNEEARQLSDRFFLETVVRIHREGEGAPYTGLKAAGTDHGPAVAAADAAIESGTLEGVEGLLLHAIRDELRERYTTMMALRDFPPDDAGRGRAFVAAYVSYVHFVEALQGLSLEGDHGHDDGDRGGQSGNHHHDAP